MAALFTLNAVSTLPQRCPRAYNPAHPPPRFGYRTGGNDEGNVSEHPQQTEAQTEAPTEWGAPRTKTVAWFDPMISAAAASSLSGLEFVSAVRDGLLPPPPIAQLMGVRLVEVAPGLAVFECTPDESAYNPIGVVHGGLVCTLTDSAAGCAVQSTLEAGVAYTSIDINVTYLRPVTKESGLIRATGRVTKPGRKVAYATVEVTDESGKLLAQATSSCLVMDNRAAT
jgi:uncharacterized protein (TIGR00369 family)